MNEELTWPKNGVFEFKIIEPCRGFYHPLVTLQNIGYDYYEDLMEPLKSFKITGQMEPDNTKIYQVHYGADLTGNNYKALGQVFGRLAKGLAKYETKHLAARTFGDYVYAIGTIMHIKHVIFQKPYEFGVTGKDRYSIFTLRESAGIIDRKITELLPNVVNPITFK